MMRGTHTTIEILFHRLLQRWVPKWYEAFSDPDLGGFYERLGHNFKPILTGQRRLITQCRQLSIYSHAMLHGCGRDLPGLRERFEFIPRVYDMPETGGMIFSADDKGAPLDASYDLYALSFVIFSMAHYFQASADDRARALAFRVLRFVDRHFRVAGMKGFVETLNPDLTPQEKVRRHESHMHMLEACLFAAEIFHETAYMKMADELVDLFLSDFYDTGRNLLSEYYTFDLRPLPQNDHVILEPGHYCEWIWLLKRHAKAAGDSGRYDALCKPMLEWASTKGWDEKYGGIYDELDPSGAVVMDTKRLWPLAEALKANALMLDSGLDKMALKNRIRKMVKVFRACYMQERGFWTEWLRRDLSRETDYMPGTTPYHVYFGIMETRAVMEGRGATRSLVARPQMFFYRVRRRCSEGIRAIRMRLKNAR